MLAAILGRLFGRPAPAPAPVPPLQPPAPVMRRPVNRLEREHRYDANGTYIYPQPDTARWDSNAALRKETLAKRYGDPDFPRALAALVRTRGTSKRIFRVNVLSDGTKFGRDAWNIVQGVDRPLAGQLRRLGHDPDNWKGLDRAIALVRRRALGQAAADTTAHRKARQSAARARGYDMPDGPEDTTTRGRALLDVGIGDEAVAHAALKVWLPKVLDEAAQQQAPKPDAVDADAAEALRRIAAAEAERGGPLPLADAEALRAQVKAASKDFDPVTDLDGDEDEDEGGGRQAAPRPQPEPPPEETGGPRR